MTSNFAFLLNNDHYGLFSRPCIEAETALKASSAQCAIASRRALELAVKWNYSADKHLKYPAREGLTNLIDNTLFKQMVGKALHEKLTYIVKLGNVAAHTSQQIERQEAVESLKGLFDYVLYLDFCYGKHYHNRAFDEQILPDLFDELTPREEIDDEVSENEMDEYLKTIKKLQQELAKAKSLNTKIREYTLSPTDYYKKTVLNLEIELKDLGYDFENEIRREEMLGYWIVQGGKSLALIEFESTIDDIEKGKEKADRYACRMKQREGLYPVIFLFDGYKTYLKSNENKPYEEVFSIFNRQEILNIIENRERRYQENKIFPELLAFQQKAVKAVYRAFNRGQDRVLMCMAYGSGKTTIARNLMRDLANGNKVLFIAENENLALEIYQELKENMRVSLLTKQQLQQSNMIITYYDEISDAIDDFRTKMSKRVITPHYFDTIILDDISKCIMQNNKNLLNYFYGRFIGLTTMSKEDLGKEIFSFFRLERPTFEYDYFSALYRDKVIVGYKLIQVDYSEDLDDRMWKKLLFDSGSLKRVIHIIRENILLEGKCLIFTDNEKQALKLKNVFYDIMSCYHQGQVEVLDRSIGKKQEFKETGGSIRIGITYGELERGVNVPDIFNIVLLKRAASKTELLQMIGRGARPCTGKEYFHVIDFCGNFTIHTMVSDGFTDRSLNELLFEKRIRLIYAIQNYESATFELEEFRSELADTVYRQVLSLDPFSYEVKQVKAVVEKYSRKESFLALSREDSEELCSKIAPLIMLEDSDEFAKRFDNLTYELILEYIQNGKVNATLQYDVIKTALMLSKIPNQKKVEKNHSLLAEVQSDAFWKNFDIIDMENVRRKLRDCVYLINQKADKLLPHIGGSDMKVHKREEIEFYL